MSPMPGTCQAARSVVSSPDDLADFAEQSREKRDGMRPQIAQRRCAVGLFREPEVGEIGHGRIEQIDLDVEHCREEFADIASLEPMPQLAMRRNVLEIGIGGSLATHGLGETNQFLSLAGIGRKGNPGIDVLARGERRLQHVISERRACAHIDQIDVGVRDQLAMIPIGARDTVGFRRRPRGGFTRRTDRDDFHAFDGTPCRQVAFDAPVRTDDADFEGTGGHYAGRVLKVMQML